MLMNPDGRISYGRTDSNMLGEECSESHMEHDRQTCNKLLSTMGFRVNYYLSFKIIYFIVQTPKIKCTCNIVTNFLLTEFMHKHN